MDELEYHEIILLLLLLQAIADKLLGDVESMLMAHIREQRRLNRSLPVDKVRILWTSFIDKITTDHFRRMFRMPIVSFNKLCQKIISNAGEEDFKSESYLLQKHPNNRLFMSGEIKVAVSIRMLAGGSYLDMVPLFDVSRSHVYNVLEEFLDWVLNTFSFPLVKWIREGKWEVLEFLANQFAEKSNGIFYGPFAAIDGLALRIRSPRLSEVPDPGNYYCRKGFYALNVQAIVDRKKRYLWSYPTNKGSTHDSSAFGASKLHDLSSEEATSEELYERGLFTSGDSAYPLSTYLISPYSVEETKDDVNGTKDAFNFYLSSCRMHVECAFGELVMRWGIFWRTLQFSIHKSTKIINVCMLLHNFIIEEREGDTEDARYFQNFSVSVDRVQEQLTRQTGEIPRPVVTDNNEPKPPGRPSLDEIRQREAGNRIRTRLTVKLASNNMRRPLQHGMKYNKYGNVIITS